MRETIRVIIAKVAVTFTFIITITIVKVVKYRITPQTSTYL